MGRVPAYLFCVLSLACFSARPAASEEAKAPAPTISPWMKFCLNETCFIGSDIRTECGVIASAVLIERNAEAKKTLRLALPTHVKQEHGLSFAIDQAQPASRPFDPCYPNGCSATYEAGSELVDQLKHGQTLSVTAVDGDNSPIHRILPLAGFAEAYDGPPAQPKAFENQPGKLQEELARRASGQAAQDQDPPKPRCPSQN
jgi:invasion protein IalB